MNNSKISIGTQKDALECLLQQSFLDRYREDISVNFGVPSNQTASGRLLLDSGEVKFKATVYLIVVLLALTTILILYIIFSLNFTESLGINIAALSSILFSVMAIFKNLARVSTQIFESLGGNVEESVYTATQ